MSEKNLPIFDFSGDNLKAKDLCVMIEVMAQDLTTTEEDTLMCNDLGSGVVEVTDGRYWERVRLDEFQQVLDVYNYVKLWLKVSSMG